MNSLIKKIPLHNKIRTARSCLLLLIVCCFTVTTNDSFAQYPVSTPYVSAQYHADIANTDNGGGTWGQILKMNARIEGSDALFNITSKKGPFYNTNSISIRSGSHTGPVIAAGKITPGSEAAHLRLDLGAVASFPHRFFATITNNIGYAWVGAVQISKNETITREPFLRENSQPIAQPARGDHGPKRPVIKEYPEKTPVNSTVNIAVTAGQTQSNDMVRIQCTASSSDNTPDTPYQSGWIYGGETIKVPLTFHSAGTQAIFCNTVNNYGESSSLSQRTIIVTPAQRFSTFSPSTREFSESVPPPAPAPRRRITNVPVPSVKVPAQASVNTPVSIKLLAGHDPRNRDLVQIECTADDSDKTTNNPYLSDWLPPEAKTKGTITFHSAGEKYIYCRSRSRQGADSPSVTKTINIRFANQAPAPPEINAQSYVTDPGKTIYIPVIAGADPERDMVKVRCSAIDSNITENAPYISDWVRSRSTVTVAPIFYTPGNKELTCVTIDRKNAQSDKATRKVHVHSSRYNPGYNHDPHFNNTPNPSDSESCACQQDGTSSFKNNASQRGITFNQPYIPEYSNSGYPSSGYPSRQNVFQAPEPQQPDLKGRVVYMSNRSPVQNALVKIWDSASGRTRTATTDYNGSFELNFTQKNLTGQIQATKGADTSVIQEVQIKANNPTIIDLIIIDRAPAHQPMQQQWSQPAQQTQQQWPAKQAPPAHNSVWQFN